MSIKFAHATFWQSNYSNDLQKVRNLMNQKIQDLPTSLWQQMYLLWQPSFVNFSLQQDHFSTQPLSPASSLQQRYFWGLEAQNMKLENMEVFNLPSCSKIWLFDGWYHSKSLVCFFSKVSSWDRICSIWQNAGRSLSSPSTPQLMQR